MAVVCLVFAAGGCSSGGSTSDTLTATTSEPTMTEPTHRAEPIHPSVPATGRRLERTLSTADGRTRTYRLYLPSSLRAGDRVPLLIALHGGIGSGLQFEANSGFDGLAEANRFIVAYPDGIGVGLRGNALRTWNAGYCCGPAVKQKVDDVGFVRALIDTIERDHPIDARRVYAAGHSNGAMLAYRLACELSDRIAAVGLQSGSLGIDGCAPRQPVSVLHIHGSADRNHPINGGVGANGIAAVEFRSARWSAETFANAIGCPSPPVSHTDATNPDLHMTSWGGCRDHTTVELIAVTGASHAWMGHAARTPGAARIVGVPYSKLDSSNTIWTFLAAHPR
jgi:polyhydroxybutyrate depolymerase